MKKQQTPPAGNELKNADFLVWSIEKAKKQNHDREITRLYNMRAQQRPPTKH